MTVLSALLVWAPQRLVTEVGNGPPRPQRQVAGFVGLAILGVLLLLFLPLPGLGARSALAAVSLCSLALAYVDVRLLVIPDLYSSALAVFGVVGPISSPPVTALLGALLGGGLVWGVRLLWRRMSGVEGLGFGDVKLAAALGCLLGPEAVLRTICVAAILGAGAGLAMRRRQRRAAAEGGEMIPFGAALAACGLGFVCWSRFT